ncbi:GTP-binding protein, partial [candidate division WWE3 bacterium]|nr:GTP-binding protein [candidate division WWE3 bacterium]
MKQVDITKLRNIAIIAHVDHGKTTLIDGILKQTHVFRDNEAEMQQTTILDSNDLERERGITILAKNTAVFWNEYKINILDTPGHVDFSGEVERVLNMADGCLLIVDAAEGVLSQTRYVLKLALDLGLEPIVVINKIDRKDQRVKEVENEIADLFLELSIHEDQLNFPILYAIAKEGVAGHILHENSDHSLSLEDSTDLSPLLEKIIEYVPHPQGNPDEPFQMQVNTIDADNYKGRYVIGRIWRGSISTGDQVAVVKDDKATAKGVCEYLYVFEGLKKVPAKHASAGEIVAITGVGNAGIGDTLTDPAQPESRERLKVDEPTLKMGFWVNTSPFAGTEGDFFTSRQLHDRLYKELEKNVGLRVENIADQEGLSVSGRGELHLSVLIENLRREGYEFAVSRPEVVLKEENGKTYEPYELVTIEVPEEYVGAVTTEIGLRKGVVQNMHSIAGQVRFEIKISTKNLIGTRNKLLTQTAGRVLMHSIFLGYEEKGPHAEFERAGSIISGETGPATTYGLNQAQQRGETIVKPGEIVYEGMIVGVNNRPDDLVMNVTKEKQLTNVRSSTSDIAVKLAPPRDFSLEQMIEF